MASYTVLSWLAFIFSIFPLLLLSLTLFLCHFSLTFPSPSLSSPLPSPFPLSFLFTHSPLVDLGDMESLFREFDCVLFKKAVADNRLGLLDASSLLWRLNIMGIEVGDERWKKVTDVLATHIGNHRSPWLV